MDIPLHDADAALLPPLNDPRRPQSGAILLTPSRSYSSINTLQLAAGSRQSSSDPLENIAGHDYGSADRIEGSLSIGHPQLIDERMQPEHKETRATSGVTRLSEGFSQTKVSPNLPRRMGANAHAQNSIIRAHEAGLSTAQILEIPSVKRLAYTPGAMRSVIFNLRNAGLLSRDGMLQAPRSLITDEQRQVIAAECANGTSTRVIRRLPQFALSPLKSGQIAKIIYGERKKLIKRNTP